MEILFLYLLNNKIRIDGAFKRPGIYEFVEGETIEDAIQLAGGFASNVPPDAKIEFSRINELNFERSYS